MKKTLLLVLALLAVGFASAEEVTCAAGAPACWDRSSLAFNITSSGCEVVSARICNVGSNDMGGPVDYDVYFAESGNPKDGVVVDSGTVPALESGECTDLTHNPGTAYGNYMFRADQRPDHPGTGELWSDAIEYDECPIPEFGLAAAGLVLVAGLGIIAYRRR